MQCRAGWVGLHVPRDPQGELSRIESWTIVGARVVLNPPSGERRHIASEGLDD